MLFSFLYILCHKICIIYLENSRSYACSEVFGIHRIIVSDHVRHIMVQAIYSVLIHIATV